MAFLPEEVWKVVQDSVPVCCVDVLPIRRGDGGSVEAVGLIWRETPHQGKRWCVVGGRLWRNESLGEAIERQIRETLGEGARFEVGVDPQPIYVIQYFTHGRAVGSVDPRQHAVTLNFCVEVGGEILAGGEAERFAWFGVGEVPKDEEMGFGQGMLLRECLGRMGGKGSS